MNESMNQTDAFMWFQKYQLEAVIRNGVVPQWFHGVISRKASEELLMCKPPGFFLIRVSESRIGAEDRCRHFMIEASTDGYVILGDDRHHRLLEDLVDFHRKFPIMPFSELLTMPCGQISDINTDYEELLFSKKDQKSPPLLPQKSIPVPDVPPVLPLRPSSMMESATQPSYNQPSRLYPSLDLLSSPCLDFPPAVPPPLPKPHIPTQPPELPSRNMKPLPKKSPLSTRTKSVPPSLPKDHRDSVDSLTSVVTNLKKFKQKLYRKSNSFDQTVHGEVAVKEDVKAEANEYHEIGDHHIVQAEHTGYSCIPINAEMPQEYLPPPPFAPGYKT